MDTVSAIFFKNAYRPLKYSGSVRQETGGGTGRFIIPLRSPDREIFCDDALDGSFFTTSDKGMPGFFSACSNGNPVSGFIAIVLFFQFSAKSNTFSFSVSDTFS